MLIVPKKHHAKCEINTSQNKGVTKLESYVAISAGKASWDHFLSSEAPLIIRKTSCYSEYLLSSGVPLIIGKTSRLREYLLLSERPFLVAPLVVSSHFCQTGSATSMDTRYGLTPIRQKCVVELT